MTSYRAGRAIRRTFTGAWYVGWGGAALVGASTGENVLVFVAFAIIGLPVLTHSEPPTADVDPPPAIEAVPPPHPIPEPLPAVRPRPPLPDKRTVAAITAALARDDLDALDRFTGEQVYAVQAYLQDRKATGG